MNPQRFDRFARALAARPSRRQVLRGAGGGVAALGAAVAVRLGRAAPSLAPSGTPGAGTPGAHGTYTSPTYGYTLTYDTAEWHPVASSSVVNQGAAHLDRLLLVNNSSHVYFDAYRDGHGAAQACLSSHLAALRSESGVRSVGPAPVAAGTPIATAPAPDAVYGAATVTYTEPGGRTQDWVVFVECRPLGGDAVLAITGMVMPNQYASQLQSLRTLIGGLSLGAPGTPAAAPATPATTPATAPPATAAPAPSGCGAGLTACNGACVNLNSDSSNCGQCGRVCVTGAVCSGGGCDCEAGLAYCAGGNVCANLATDPANCGACGNGCASGVCTGGACAAPSCAQQGLTACGGTCVNTATDAANCGSCGKACDGDQVCRGGDCVARG